MKLNISAKELLALHNLLDSRYGRTFDGDDLCDSKAVHDDEHLRQVHNRVRACIIGALSVRASDPIDAFLSKEQVKIDKLKAEVEHVKEEQSDLAAEFKFEEELEPDSDFVYPRRGSRQKQPGGGRKR